MEKIRSRALSRTTALLLGGAAFGLMLADVAAAQEAIEVVTVTARARAEDIHNVPSQVTAFPSDLIESMGIRKPQDFLSAVPNVTFVETQNAGTSFVVMRGISQARNSEPSAAIVVDGVPMTQPAQFNQELVDIQQIEVVKGPQGALYGRDAIGGAIIITTKAPSDVWEGSAMAGYENGPGYRVSGVVSGPVTDTLGVRLAASYFDTDGHLRNVNHDDSSAKRDVDPVKDFNARFTALWRPNERLTVDFRAGMDLLDTRALYYVIPDFGTPEFNDPDYTGRPIDLNNSGYNARKVYDAAVKINYDTPGVGTFTSITGYNSTWEVLAGDGYTFDPFGPFPINRINFNFNQSQFLKVHTFTQEFRWTSPQDRRFRYIFGGAVYRTTRFISTGNMFDVNDEGVIATYYHPNPAVFAPHGQISWLADSQDQAAWAVYLDTSTNLSDSVELSLNVRYDRDHRENTTKTPDSFLASAGIPGHFGDVRTNTWDDIQPQAILRWTVDENINLYGSYSRGFRSGGFNQTGVATAAALAGFDNVGDEFNAETADTIEGGFKSRWFDDRLTVNGSAYFTWDHNDYYFVFLASNSTQNLGNIRQVEFKGFDLDFTARLTDNLMLNGGFGLTDSEITSFPGASSGLVVGAKAPLVPDYTLNLGLQYDQPIMEDVSLHVRVDYNRIGPTIFVIPVPAAGEPVPKERSPVDLVNLRASLDWNSWDLTFWSRNLFDKKYNTEYSTGGFLFKAQPMTWGLELRKSF